jgi:thiamine biosynthesis protein ThiS
MPVTIQLNGEAREFDDGATVLTAVAALGLSPGQVAVERNLEVVPRATYAEVRLEDNDRVEVVSFVGGG